MSNNETKIEETTNVDEIEYTEIPYDDCYDKKFYLGSSTSSLLVEFLKNIRPGVDLLRTALPAFVLEKRSLLEKLTDYMNHQHLILNISTMIDPEQRFFSVVKHYIAMWHQIPEVGVAKPYNPILGEVFKCEWKLQDSVTSYISEQVSHHPPISAFHFENKKKNFVIYGTLQPKAHLYPFGNYASMTMNGPLKLKILNLDEEYDMTYASVSVKGVFFGTMQMENSGKTIIECKKTGYRASITWKTGRQLSGKIYKNDKKLYSLKGDYTDVVYIKNPEKKKQNFEFLNIKKLEKVSKTVTPTKDQQPNESRKVWYKVSVALDKRDFDAANKYKNEIEQRERDIREERKKRKEVWTPKLFQKKDEKDELSYMYIGVFVLVASQTLQYKNIEITDVIRNIDARGLAVKHSITMNVKNVGDKETSRFYLAVRNEDVARLAYMTVTDGLKRNLSVSKEKQASDEKNTIYKVLLKKGLSPKDSEKILIYMVFTNSLVPYPKTIQQNENQKVLFSDNVYFYSPHLVKTQKTEVNTGTSNVESFTKFQSEKRDSRVIFGPYHSTPAFSYYQMKVHYQNNNPLVRIPKLVRLIEISHWGALSIEEHYEVKHAGAALKNGFSRLDYQRNPMLSSPSSFRKLTAKLPKEASDIYFRDRIGNVSSSTCRPSGNTLEVDFLPRYPLFGGWKIDFYIGYVLPIENYLQTKGEEMLLKTTFGAPFDDVVIDDMTVKVIVPEGATNIKVDLPFDVDSEERETLKTYLDTTGRTVVVLKKKNVVPDHNQNFSVHYNFSKINFLRKPLVPVGLLFALCLFIIAYVRFDLTIKKSDKELEEEKQTRIAEIVEQYIEKQLQRNALYRTVESDPSTKKTVKNQRSALDNEINKEIIEKLREMRAVEVLQQILRVEKLEKDKFLKLEEILSTKADKREKLEMEYENITDEIMNTLDDLKDE